MSDLLDEYNERLRERDIGSYDVTILEGKLGRNDPKFDSTGKAKPFYGLTCIAWIDRTSELFRRLRDLQKTFESDFEQAGLGGIFSFLEPKSFHMTICDIDANSDPTQIRVNDRIEEVQRALGQIGTPGRVTCRIEGIGLKITITALVRFDCALELKKVLDMEHKIKQSTGVNVRDFTGHVSLAYFVRHPRRNIERIKQILSPYANRALGEFVFYQLDLTYFTDMNTFMPIMTIDLEHGKVTHHDRFKECPS